MISQICFNNKSDFLLILKILNHMTILKKRFIYTTCIVIYNLLSLQSHYSVLHGITIVMLLLLLSYSIYLLFSKKRGGVVHCHEPICSLSKLSFHASNNGITCLEFVYKSKFVCCVGTCVKLKWCVPFLYMYPLCYKKT